MPVPVVHSNTDHSYDSDSDPGSEVEALKTAEVEEIDTPDLPELTDRAAVYAGSCLGLSAPLVAHLQSLLPKAPALTLSIGSGFGLLEALLLDEAHAVVGVEVQPSPNTYLPATNHRIVHGTRFLDPLAAKAEAWLFVYPRRVALVDEYMAAHSSRNLHTIIWAGPHADWNDYKPCFAAGWHVQTQSAQEVGGKAWELIAVAHRLPKQP
ncbi:hypothetical protein E8E13_008818 [Curvularia kusanoi]|uniref:Methyltransferase n=1 Tax=Curvularia kusanoi TaxID=90978 RepID=A0A9P4TCY9_CURKU|nr:hypothetical protein E8E13_008818 [Curvularia kusanoi]